MYKNINGSFLYFINYQDNERELCKMEMRCLFNREINEAIKPIVKPVTNLFKIVLVINESFKCRVINNIDISINSAKIDVFVFLFI